MKYRAPLVCAAAFFLNLFISNTSFAIQDLQQGKLHPDYAYEFCGKDTCEKFNRKLFIFNLKLNKFVLRPINTVWASVMPKYAMDRMQSAYDNVNFPTRLVGCLLQGDFKASKQETLRFLTNTTLGVGGLYDPAKTRFKLEPRKEDVAQGFAHYKFIKKGPYLVIPVLHGNARDVAGQLLNYPLNPCSYVLGPLAAVAGVVFFVNNTTYMQPLIKKVETSFADPYVVVKQADGVENYIKNNNIDRTDFLKAPELVKVPKEELVKVSVAPTVTDLKADIVLSGFNPQSPFIDAMRTALFDNHNYNTSIWSDLSVWNKCFDKRIKTTSVSIYDKRPNYKYRYILQKNQTSPLAILYPSIGEGIMADKSIVLAKMLYDEGYSVIIEGSPCNCDFIKSMPKGYSPGLPTQDANYLRVATSKIIDDVQRKRACKFDKRIVVGCSFGAMTSLFVAAQEEVNNTLSVSNYIAINPPIEIFFAMNQLDKYSQEWKNDSSDLKTRAAITVEKVLQKSQQITDKKFKDNDGNFPFTDDEAKLIMGFIMKQKLSDVIFAIEDCSTAKKNSILYDNIGKMSYSDYSQKYLFANQTKPQDQLIFESSLYSISDFLKNSDKYKIFHSIDDYYVSPEQLVWLKKISDKKSIFFSNGSHLGCLYRKEFLDEFKKATQLENAMKQNELAARGISEQLGEEDVELLKDTLVPVGLSSAK